METAKLKFESFHVSKIDFNINSFNIESSALDINIEKQDEINKELFLFKTILTMEIKDKNGLLNLDVIIVGQFSYNESVSETMLNNYVNVCAPAILFPYLRSYISSLTVLSGISAIILPLVNFTE